MAFPSYRGGRMPISFAPRGPQIAPRAPFNSNQKFGFFSPQTQPVARLPVRPVINVNVKKELPQAPPPIVATTIFVGNITDACSDELIQKILTQCGTMKNWKRLQDSNSKFKAFGFCDFDAPDGTLRALKILNDFQLGDKKLTVKADEATQVALEAFTKSKKPGSKQNGADGENDQQILAKILEIIKEENAELLPSANPERRREKSEDSNSSRDSRNGAKRSHKQRHSNSRRRRSNSSSRRTESRSRRSRSSEISPKKKHNRRRSSESSSGSSSSDSSAGSKRKTHRKRRNSSRESEDSDDVKERRRLKQEIKRKEQSYMKRLEKWEARERRMAKQYEKDEEGEIQRKKMIQREAKKLKQFLEDYEDERDDTKYYKSSSLFQRRRNYERERQEDVKDRQEEVQEIEELKKQILSENKDVKVEDADAEARKLHEAKGKEKLKCYRGHSGSPTPHRPLGQQPTQTPEVKEDEEGSSSNNTSSNPTPDGKKEVKEPGTWASINESGDKSRKSSEQSEENSHPKRDGGTKLVATIQKPSSSIARINGVFDDDEDDENSTHQIKKKIKPFEITREDRIASMTPEERKKLTKDLIERIPTGKEELFAFTITWEFVDESLLEKRIKPWINKKICEI